MNPLVQTVLVVGVSMSTVAIALGALELSRIRNLLVTGRIKVEKVPMSISILSTAAGPLSSPAGYAVFVSRGGRWILEADLSKPGYEAVAPSIAGSYEGQCVKKESALKGEG